MRDRSLPAVRLAVDLVVLTVSHGELVALLVTRGVPPHEGVLALPGGFVREGEDLPAAAARELAEETGLTVDGHLEQLGTYGTPDRDPRGRVVTVAYLALLPQRVVSRGLAAGEVHGGGDAAAASWLPAAAVLDDPPAAGPLAFDHDRILADGIARARAKIEYTPLAASFCDSPFTIAELRAVYEAVWGVALDPRNFHRKVTGAEGFLEPTADRTTRQGGRPAQLYGPGSARLLHPPMLSPDSLAALQGRT